MSIVLAWLAVAAYVAAAVIALRRRRDDAPGLFDTADLQKEILLLHEAAKRLDDLDTLIIDLRLCRPSETVRAFRMEWQSVSGQAHSFDFMADGEDVTTGCLLEMAERERDELNEEIAQRIFDLYQMAVLLTGGREKR